jgi:hypothetical protein
LIFSLNHVLSTLSPWHTQRYDGRGYQQTHRWMRFSHVDEFLFETFARFPGRGHLFDSCEATEMKQKV